MAKGSSGPLGSAPPRGPEHTREQISARIEQLLENPRQGGDGYEELTDQWTTTYGGDVGLIVYAVVHERQRVIILRLV